jgi:hypothetical protein
MAAIGDSFFIQTFTTTLQRYERQLVDNILKDHPTLELFKATAKSITGRGLVIPIRAKDLNGTDYVNSAAASGQFSTGFSADIMGSAVYEWSNEIVTPFRLKHRDILMNAGPEQIVSLVEEYVKAAQAVHQDFIVAELHKHRTSYDLANNAVLSLDMLVGNVDSDADFPVGTPAVGGIDPSVLGKEYWQATRVYANASVDIFEAMRNTTNRIYAASRKRPTDVIAGFDCYEDLESALMEKGWYASSTGPNDGTANTRFTQIKFGDLIVRLDPDCQRDRMYFLHRPSLRFAYCAGEFMKAYPAQPLEGTLDTVVPMASTLIFGVAERRANGVLIRQTDATTEVTAPGI